MSFVYLTNHQPCRKQVTSYRVQGELSHRSLRQTQMKTKQSVQIPVRRQAGMLSVREPLPFLISPFTPSCYSGSKPSIKVNRVASLKELPGADNLSSPNP